METWNTRQSLEAQLMAKIVALHITPSSILCVSIPDDYDADALDALRQAWLEASTEVMGTLAPAERFKPTAVVLKGDATLEQIDEAMMNQAGWYRKENT